MKHGPKQNIVGPGDRVSGTGRALACMSAHIDVPLSASDRSAEFESSPRRRRANAVICLLPHRRAQRSWPAGRHVVAQQLPIRRRRTSLFRQKPLGRCSPTA